jgi:NTE family protein
MAQQIINLAFKGGGVKGIAYAGAYKALYEAGLMKNVKRIAGSSAGAVFAAIACLGYDPDEVKDIIGGTSFASFMDKKDILRIMSKYGIYKGDAFLSWMEKQVAGSKLDKKLTKTATFRDLKNAGGRDLHVFSADISTHQLIEFSYETSPDVVVAEAVRASMSIPLFFEAWRFRNNNPNNHYYVDGGMVYNYPVTAFDHYGDGRDATLGFYLLNFNAPPVPLGTFYKIENTERT